MTKRLMDLERVTPGAWAVLAVLIASCAAIVIWAPPHFWDSLARADWRHVAGVITLVGGSFVALLVQWKRETAEGPGLSTARPRWERPGYDDEDPTGPQSPRALDRRDRPPGDSARPRALTMELEPGVKSAPTSDVRLPRPRRDGYASPDLLGVVLATACGGLVLLTAIAIAGALLSGCDGPPGPARRAVEVATVVLLDADRDAAVRYTAAAEVALERSTTLAEYRAAMAPHDALEQALRVTQSAILAADAALDAWREGGAERWPSLAACVVMALADLRNALAAAGVHAPPELDAVITTARSFALSACPGGA